MNFIAKMLKKLCAAVTAAGVMAAALVLPAAADDAIILPDNEAISFVNGMGAGWNLGNAMDAVNCTWLSNEMDYETAWCGAATTRELIKAVADKGFSTIRIPVSWHNHVDGNFNISEQWMARVKEIVDWSVDAGLYVILNSHHDIEKGYYYPTEAEYKTSEKYVKKIWEQISAEFKDYNDKLVFETSNEPRAVGTDYEWWINANSPSAQAKESIDCINRLNQAALDTIRASGGNNKNRFVMVPGYATSADGVKTSYFELPKDSVKNRLIVTIHIYTDKKGFYIAPLKSVYEKFVKNGIPVFLGEYNENSGSNAYDSQSAEFLGGLVKYARERGISCAIWDNNAKEFKIIDRKTLKWVHDDVAKAVVENGASAAVKTEQKSAKPVLTAKAGNKKVTLSWTAVDGAAKYKVYRYQNGKLTAVKTTKNQKLTIKSLKNGTAYTYAVKAYVNGKWTAVKKADMVSVTPKK